MSKPTSSYPDRPSAQAVASRTRRLAVPCVLLAVFLAAVNQTVVTTAMPGIVSQFGEFGRYTWPTVSYLLAAAVGMLAGGRMGEGYGSGRVIALGLAVFAAGCLAVSFAENMTELIALRTVEGLGGGCALVGCHLSATELYSPRERGVFQAWVAVVYGLAFMAGPLLGGFVSDRFGWPWIFRIHCAVGIVALLLILAAHRSAAVRADRQPMDYPGIALLLAMAVPAVLALILGGVRFDWTSWEIAVLLSLSMAAACVLVRVELRSESPIVPLHIYRDRTVAVAAASTALTAFALYSIAFILPVLYQVVGRATASGSGAFLAPTLLAFVVGGAASGVALARTDLRFATVLRVNGACMLSGMALLAFVSADTAPLATVACSVIAGLGMGGMLAVLTVLVQQLPATVVSAATAALQYCRLLGGLVGLAVLGAGMGWRFEHRVRDGSGLDAASRIPPAVLDAVADNPGLLFDPADRGVIEREVIGSIGDDAMAATVVESLERAMQASVVEIFWLCLAIVAACVAVSLLTREPAPDQPPPGGE